MIIFTRNLVVKDFWLKLFALALAILIWLTVKINNSGESSPLLALIGRPPNERELTVSVHVPSGTLQKFSAVPAEVQVTLRGDSKLLKTLTPQSIRAEVDLTGIESANGLLRPIQIILPKGIFYTHLEPDEVEVQVSR